MLAALAVAPARRAAVPRRMDELPEGSSTKCVMNTQTSHGTSGSPERLPGGVLVAARCSTPTPHAAAPVREVGRRGRVVNANYRALPSDRPLPRRAVAPGVLEREGAAGPAASPAHLDKQCIATRARLYEQSSRTPRPRGRRPQRRVGRERPGFIPGTQDHDGKENCILAIREHGGRRNPGGGLAVCAPAGPGHRAAAGLCLRCECPLQPEYANERRGCDDGGPGAAYDYCGEIGSDCDDCGPRCSLPHRRRRRRPTRRPPPPPPLPPPPEALPAASHRRPLQLVVGRRRGRRRATRRQPGLGAAGDGRSGGVLHEPPATTIELVVAIARRGDVLVGLEAERLHRIDQKARVASACARRGSARGARAPPTRRPPSPPRRSAPAARAAA